MTKTITLDTINGGPTFTTSPNVPTPAVGDSSPLAAPTAFVTAAITAEAAARAAAITALSSALTSATIPASSLGQPGGPVQLDLNGNVSNENFGVNSLVASNVAALIALPSTGFVTGNYADIHEYVSGTGYGGGRFKFVSTATLADPGYNLCPTDRTTAIVAEAHGTGTGVACFTGNINGKNLITGTVFGGTITIGQTVSRVGSTLGTISSGSGNYWVLSASQFYPSMDVLGGSYTGTLTNASTTQPILPGSVVFSFGGASNITDDSGGYLYWNYLRVGTISYTTGVYAFTQYIASGQAITASYSQCTAAGRWTRLFVSPYANIRDFGAVSDNATDIHNAFQAANLYAVTNKKALYVPSPLSGGGWKAKSPSIVTCKQYIHEASNTNTSNGGTFITFSPPVIYDQLACVYIAGGNGVTVERAATIGPESSLGTPSTMMSSGWIPSTSSFQGTISAGTVSQSGSLVGTGNAINIASGLTGAPNIGDQLSGVGMTAGPSAISGPAVTCTGHIDASASFVAAISNGTGSAGTQLNVTQVNYGTISVGSNVLVGSSLISNTVITGQASGTPGGVGIYTVNNSQLIASETMTQANLSVAGTTLTITANTFGAILIGQTIYVANPNSYGPALSTGLTIVSQYSGTTGSTGVYIVSGPTLLTSQTLTQNNGILYQISPSQPLISTAQTFTTCGLPDYNAIKAGTVGIAVTGQVVLKECATSNHKIGCLLNSTQGHCEFHSCAFSGFIGQYVADNSYDFSWWGGGFGGTWAGFAFGNSNVVGSSGGCTGTWFRVQFPLEPVLYHIYQFCDSGNVSSAAGLNGAFYSCSFESFTEAMIQLLPTAAGTTLYLIYSNFDSFNNSSLLPSTITPTPQQNLMLLGSVEMFVATINQASAASGTWFASSLGGGAYPQYSLNCTFYGYASHAPLNLTMFNSSELNITGMNQSRWVGYERSFDLVWKGDLEVHRDLAHTGNILKNPEVLSNWTNTNPTNSTVTIAPFYSSTYPELASIVIPRNVTDVLGQNPMVMKVLPTGSANISMEIAPNIANLVCGPSPVWVRFFALQLTTSVQIGFRIQTPSTNYLYYQTYTDSPNTITEHLGVNQVLGHGNGDTTNQFNILNIFTNNATVYLMGVQAGIGEIAPYNPLAIPVSNGGLALGDSSGLSSTYVQVLSGTGAPTGSAPDGTIYMQKGSLAGSTGVWQYNGNSSAWLQLGSGSVVTTQSGNLTTGSTVTIPAGCSNYIVQATGNLAALTIVYPSVSGATGVCKVVLQVAVASLTVEPPSGNTMIAAPTNMSAPAGTTITKLLVGTVWS